MKQKTFKGIDDPIPAGIRTRRKPVVYKPNGAIQLPHPPSEDAVEPARLTARDKRALAKIPIIEINKGDKLIWRMSQGVELPCTALGESYFGGLCHVMLDQPHDRVGSEAVVWNSGLSPQSANRI